MRLTRLALALLLASLASAAQVTSWALLHSDGTMDAIMSAAPPPLQRTGDRDVPVTGYSDPNWPGPWAYDPSTLLVVPAPAALAAAQAAASDRAPLAGMGADGTADPNSPIGQALAQLDQVAADMAALQSTLPASPSSPQMRAAILTMGADMAKLAAIERKLLRVVARDHPQ